MRPLEGPSAGAAGCGSGFCTYLGRRTDRPRGAGAGLVGRQHPQPPADGSWSRRGSGHDPGIPGVLWTCVTRGNIAAFVFDDPPFEVSGARSASASARPAAENGYGIPAFNVNNLEQVQAIMEAADETDSPVILQASRGARSYAQ